MTFKIGDIVIVDRTSGSDYVITKKGEYKNNSQYWYVAFVTGQKDVPYIEMGDVKENQLTFVMEGDLIK